jgi:hypothetical protein
MQKGKLLRAFPRIHQRIHFCPELPGFAASEFSSLHHVYGIDRCWNTT